MTDYAQTAPDDVVAQTVHALEERGFTVQTVDTLKDAKEAVAKLIPNGSSVFTATSKTLEATGITALINEGYEYEAIRPKLTAMMMNEPENVVGRKKLTAAVDYVVGSVAALTEKGELLIASATGSQIAPEAYGASHVIYVISTKKIVKDIADGFRRVEEYIFPQERERVRAQYNKPDLKTYFSKLFMYLQDYDNRVVVVLVKEPAGF